MIDTKSTYSEADAPRGKFPSLQRTILGAVCLLVIVVYWYTAYSGAGLVSSLHAADSYYNLLTQGFRAGQLNLKIDVPAGLTQAADPYDPFSRSDDGVHDMSFYKGKLFLYFGPTPVLLLFWPYVALTGHYLPQKDAAAIFCIVGFLVSAGLLCALWRHCFDNVSVIVIAACVLALGLTTSVPLMLCRPDVYEVAISSGYMLTMIAMAAIWRSLHEPAQRCWWLALASLAYGLAVGARPSLLFGAVILLVPIFHVLRERQSIWAPLIAVTGPIMVVGLGLMLYNDLRFDSPLEFGQRYQLASYRAVQQRFFGFGYFWYNFRVYFLEPARWTARFPFVNQISVPLMPKGHYLVESPFGVLSNTPVVLLSAAVPLAWRGRSGVARFILRGFSAAVVLLFGICALTLCFFRGACIRYEVEFTPALLLLAAVGILGLERALADQRAWRCAARWGWGLLLGFSLVFNLLAIIAGCAEARNSLGHDLDDKGKTKDAISQYEQALRFNPNSAVTRFNLGTALAEIGKSEDAIRQYEEALRLDPKLAGVHVNLATTLLQVGRAQEAIDHYEQALRISPDYIEAHNNLGLALLQLGRVQEAIDRYQQALSFEPNSVDAHYNLGNALVQAGRVQEAIDHYQQTLRIKPDSAEAHNNLGLALLQLGRVQEAVGQFQQALQIKPDFTAAQYNLRSASERRSKLQESVTH